MNNIRIYLKIKGVLKGKRRATIHLIRVGDISHSGPISPEMVVDWEKLAWIEAQKTMSKFKNVGSLNFHKLNIDGDMEEVYMQPIRSVLVMSELGSLAI